MHDYRWLALSMTKTEKDQELARPPIVPTRDPDSSPSQPSGIPRAAVIALRDQFHALFTAECDCGLVQRRADAKGVLPAGWFHHTHWCKTQTEFAQKVAAIASQLDTLLTDHGGAQEQTQIMISGAAKVESEGQIVQRPTDGNRGESEGGS